MPVFDSARHDSEGAGSAGYGIFPVHKIHSELVLPLVSASNRECKKIWNNRDAITGRSYMSFV